MGEAGRKLTIRMPDNPRLRSVVVGQMHVDPGGRVLAGTPVMSLAKKRRDHIVRSPRPGRIVPLVAVGDKVEPGDPLYILHIDEAALAEAKREKNALVPVAQAKWSNGITPDAIRPIARGRKPKPDLKEPGRPGQFAARWGKPILAIALYVMACFALLPILHTFAAEASVPLIVAMCAGSVLFGALIYYLYRPDAGAAPRWTVRMVAASWVGIAGMAIFYQPNVTEDITLADATTTITNLFEPVEEAPAIAQPEDVDEPPLVVTSGVRFGRTLVQSAPRQVPPSSVLTDPEIWDDPHNVVVKAWARVMPSAQSGDEMTFNQQDILVSEDEVEDARLVIARAVLPAQASDSLQANAIEPPRRALRDPGDRIASVPVILSEGIEGVGPIAYPSLAVSSTAPDVADQRQAIEVAAFTPGSVPDAEKQSVDAWLGIDGVPLQIANDTGAVAPVEIAYTGNLETQAGAVTSGEPPAPVRVASASVLGSDDRVASALALNREVAAHARWPLDGSVPVIMSRAGTPAEPRDSSWRGDVASLRPDRAATPLERPRLGNSPDLLLMSQRRISDENWMQDQAELLVAAEAKAPATGRASDGTGLPSKARSVAELSAAVRQTEPDIRLAARDGQDTTGASPIVGSALEAAPSIGQAPNVQGRAAPTPEQPSIPTDLQLVTLPEGVPAAPPVDPGTEKRLLLYVYFDDPRLETHPSVGDKWTAAVSDKLAGSIRHSEVVEVKQIVQVERWCEAANNPDGALDPQRPGDFQTAWLSDRIRLLKVQVEVDAHRIAAFETEIPLFDGTPAGFFHNRAPLLGGKPGAPLLDDGMAYLRSLSAGIIDPNQPSFIEGGQYFDSPVALAAVLRGAGCVQAEWNGGGAPDNAIGRELDRRLGG